MPISKISDAIQAKVLEGRAILNRADEEERDLTSKDRDAVDRILAEVRALQTDDFAASITERSQGIGIPPVCVTPK